MHVIGGHAQMCATFELTCVHQWQCDIDQNEWAYIMPRKRRNFFERVASFFQQVSGNAPSSHVRCTCVQAQACVSQLGKPALRPWFHTPRGPCPPNIRTFVRLHPFRSDRFPFRLLRSKPVTRRTMRIFLRSLDRTCSMSCGSKRPVDDPMAKRMAKAALSALLVAFATVAGEREARKRRNVARSSS